MLYTTLRQLEYITAIARAGSLTDAAQQLHVSQPALSVAISQVEDRQRQKIFIRRKGSPITLTSFGREFVRDAEKLLSDAARLEDPRTSEQRSLQTITLGCFEDLAPLYLAPLLKQLKNDFPDLAVTPLVTGFENLAHAIQSGQIELAVTYDLGLDASFERKVLTNLSPHAFMPPNHLLATQSKLNLKKLADQPLILSNQGLSIAHMIKLFRAKKLLPHVVHRAASLEVMRSLAANDEGIGISYSIPPTNLSYDGKPLITIPISDKEACEPIVLVRSKLNPPITPIPLVQRSIESSEIFKKR